MPKKAIIILAALAIGVIDTLVLKVFEFAVNNGTHYIWDDLFNTGVNRWAVIPLAIGLGVLFSALLVWMRQPRLVPPKINSMEAEKNEKRPTLKSIGIVAIIGLASLLAGASLGPEASLVAMTSGLGLWIAYRSKLDNAAKLLELASIGGLLVAFVGSYVLVLLPLAMLKQKKQLTFATAIPVLLAGATAFGTLWLIDHSTSGYGAFPTPPHFTPIDLPLAAVLGLATALLGWLLKRFILGVNSQAKKLDKKCAWPITGALFGLVIGVLYLVGGQSVQFSGDKGSVLLVNHQPAYGLAALCVILVAKLLVTGWSLATGYRGGLVFPSIFIGITIALIAESIFGMANSGVMIGSIAGVFSAMTGPVPALIFMVGLLPFKLIGLAIVGIAFAAFGNKLIDKFAPAKP